MTRIVPLVDAAAGEVRPRALLVVSELEDYAIAFANGLARHADVILAVPRRRYERFAAEIAPEVDLRLLDWPRHRSARNLATIAALTSIVRRERPDVIHVLSNNTLWLNLALPLWRPIPVVTTVHDVEVHPGDRETQTLPQWATTLAARQSGDLVVHGDRLQALAARRFGKAAERVHVLSHPALPRYAALAAREGLARRANSGGFSVLMFGRLYAYKGLGHLVAAERLLGDAVPELRVVIAGRGDDPAALLPAMGDPARYDIRHRFIEDREVAQLFLDADVVVLPYVEGSQSGVLNIAAAFGRPVIATDVGELGATVRGNGLGLVVPPGDPAALAAAIARMAGDAQFVAKACAAALRWANGPNAPETVGAAAAGLYRSILARRGPAGRRNAARRAHPPALRPLAGETGFPGTAAPRSGPAGRHLTR